MALTPEQESQLIADAAASKAAIEALKAENATVKTQLAEKDTAITALNSSSQEAAFSALKAKYPDVPEAVLKALPVAERDAHGKLMQDNITKLKTVPTVKTGADAWQNFGGIGPSVEAEDSAALAARTAARDKAASSGNFMEVLRVKSRDTIEFIGKNFATR